MASQTSVTAGSSTHRQTQSRLTQQQLVLRVHTQSEVEKLQQRVQAASRTVGRIARQRGNNRLDNGGVLRALVTQNIQNRKQRLEHSFRLYNGQSKQQQTTNRRELMKCTAAGVTIMSHLGRWEGPKSHRACSRTTRSTPWSFGLRKRPLVASQSPRPPLLPACSK